MTDPIDPMRVSDYREHDERDAHDHHAEDRQADASGTTVRALQRHTFNGQGYEVDATYEVDNPAALETLELLGYARRQTGGV